MWPAIMLSVGQFLGLHLCRAATFIHAGSIKRTMHLQAKDLETLHVHADGLSSARHQINAADGCRFSTITRSQQHATFGAVTGQDWQSTIPARQAEALRLEYALLSIGLEIPSGAAGITINGPLPAQLVADHPQTSAVGLCNHKMLRLSSMLDNERAS